MFPHIKSEVIIILRDIFFVIIILLAFFVGYLAVRGLDSFLGNSGKRIRRQTEKNKNSLISKMHPTKKKKPTDGKPYERFFRTNIGESRHFSVINMENRADL